MTLRGEDINVLIRSKLPPQLRGLIPPPCLTEMYGEFLDYEEGSRLRMRFPVLVRYRNPMGNMQGGFLVAALDNTIGPFSFLIASPSVTTSLNTQYLRPVGADTAFLTCSAWLVERTRNVLHIHAEARNEQDKVVALAQSVNQIVPQLD